MALFSLQFPLDPGAGVAHSSCGLMRWIASGSYHAPGSGLRYRRKVPLVAAETESSAAPSDSQSKEDARSDNQQEHQSEEPAAVAPLDKQASTVSASGVLRKKNSKSKLKSRAPPSPKDAALRSAEGPGRGKKDATRTKFVRRSSREPGMLTEGTALVIMHANEQAVCICGAEHAVDEASADNNAEGEDVVGSKRQVSEATGRESRAAHKTATQSRSRRGSSSFSNMPDHRKHKQFGRKQSTAKRPGLLKQLLWKAKPQQPQQTEMQTPAASTSLSTVRTDVGQAADVVPAKDNNAIDIADEEAAFAAEERRLLKLQAKEMSYPFEASSQETQSGSEDDVGFVHAIYGGDDVDDDAGSLQHTSPLDTFFPVAFPLECLSSDGLNIHEILIEDFTFSPQEMQIEEGDVVVWRVSEQTMGMVEHCLDVSLTRKSDEFVVMASTPSLAPGDHFAWRFETAGLVAVDCSVYNTHGSICVDSNSHDSEVVQPITEHKQRQKQKLSRKQQKRLAKMKDTGAARVTKTSEEPEHVEENVEIFHSPTSLDLSADMDTGVCRAVLSQLEEVKAGSSVILFGDIACHVPSIDGAEAHKAPAVPGDGLEGDEVTDFQERVIAMLRRSEQSLARQRGSFVVEGSGFDALSAYDFLKQRKLVSLP